ncbi:hypothetical protein CC78DRAFT_569422 [Lojkania enalia]|uniref:Uncharacterized protein n=1 Tax=Lojkania enalia TaxID=147567 RepID=A0A9P4K5C3_9PLEO|nr:hypothetical protein CC78DRAFT_569422 [Didymosphaeria enalia]
MELQDALDMCGSTGLHAYRLAVALRHREKHWPSIFKQVLRELNNWILSGALPCHCVQRNRKRHRKSIGNTPIGKGKGVRDEAILVVAGALRGLRAARCAPVRRSRTESDPSFPRRVVWGVGEAQQIIAQQQRRPREPTFDGSGLDLQRQ